MKTLSPKMDELLAPPTNMLLPSSKIRRVQSLDRLSGDSLECKMRREGGSFMDLAIVEHEIDHDFVQRILVLRLKQKQKREDAYKGVSEQIRRSEEHGNGGLPQCIQPEEEGDDESTYIDSIRRSLRSMRHTNFVYISYVEKTDPTASDIEQKQNKLEEPENQCQDSSEDSDDVGSDEQIWIPSKSRWLAMCLAIWGVEADVDVISEVKASKLILEIFTDGVSSNDGNSGCGAIIRDSCQRPIVARSKVNTKGEYVSPFCLQLKGIALGVELAKKYNVSRFYLYCPSEDVCEFINGSWGHRGLCFCSGKRETVKSHCGTCSIQRICAGDRKDHDKAFDLAQHIISELDSFGVSYFDAMVSNGESERNEAAHFLAQIQEDKDLKLG